MKIEPLLTASDVATLLAVNVETIRRMTRRGMLPSILLGRSRRYAPEDIQATIKRQRSTVSTVPTAPR